MRVLLGSSLQQHHTWPLLSNHQAHLVILDHLLKTIKGKSIDNQTVSYTWYSGPSFVSHGVCSLLNFYTSILSSQLVIVKLKYQILLIRVCLQIAMDGSCFI